MYNERTREMVYGGILLAIGILLPIAFHAFGMGGQIFLPMHIPVLLGGFLLSPLFALVLGIITPLLSATLTGMPVLYPMGVIMAVELGIYALSGSLLKKVFIRKDIIVLILSMLAGRIAAGLTVFILASSFGLKLNSIIYVKGALLTGIPGIIIQLLLIPSVLLLLRKYGIKE